MDDSSNDRYTCSDLKKKKKGFNNGYQSTKV